MVPRPGAGAPGGPTGPGTGSATITDPPGDGQTAETKRMLHARRRFRFRRKGNADVGPTRGIPIGDEEPIAPSATLAMAPPAAPVLDRGSAPSSRCHAARRTTRDDYRHPSTRPRRHRCWAASRIRRRIPGASSSRSDFRACRCAARTPGGARRGGGARRNPPSRRPGWWLRRAAGARRSTSWLRPLMPGCAAPAYVIPPDRGCPMSIAKHRAWA